MQQRRAQLTAAQAVRLQQVPLGVRPGKVTVTVHTGRPGVVIGKRGAEVDKLRDELSQLTGKEAAINVEEIKRPELSAQLVADNIARRRRGRPYVHYDGYSTAPITVARDRLVLAEFDRTGTITPSVPVVDLTRTRRSTWAYDRYLQPQLYWHSILKGRVKR